MAYGLRLYYNADLSNYVDFYCEGGISGFKLGTCFNKDYANYFKLSLTDRLGIPVRAVIKRHNNGQVDQFFLLLNNDYYAYEELSGIPNISPATASRIRMYALYEENSIEFFSRSISGYQNTEMERFLEEQDAIVNDMNNAIIDLYQYESGGLKSGVYIEKIIAIQIILTT